MRLSAQKRVGVVVDASVEFIGSGFVVRNNNNFAWKDVSVELNSRISAGGFVFKTQEVHPGRTRTIGMGEFVDQDGAQFNSLPRSVTSRPKSFGIRCNTQFGGGFWLGVFV